MISHISPRARGHHCDPRHRPAGAILGAAARLSQTTSHGRGRTGQEMVDRTYRACPQGDAPSGGHETMLKLMLNPWLKANLYHHHNNLQKSLTISCIRGYHNDTPMVIKNDQSRVKNHDAFPSIFPEGDPELQQALLKAGKSFRLPNLEESQRFCAIN